MTQIEAGFAADFQQSLKQLSSKLANFLDSLTKKHTDWKVEKLEERKDGSRRFIIQTGVKEKVRATVSPVKGDESKFNILFETEKDHKKKEYKNVSENKFEEVFTEAIDELLEATMESYKEDTGEVKQNRQVQVRLRRIEGSKSQAIRLERITANYNITAAYADVASLLENDSVLPTIPETGCDYCIAVDNDFFDIQEQACTFAPIDLYAQGVAACLGAMLDCHYLELNAIGEECTYARNLVNSFKYTYEWMYSAMARMCVEFAQACPHPRDLINRSEASFVDPIQGYFNPMDRSHILLRLEACGNHVVGVLEAVYANYPRDAQQQIDNMIRELKSKLELDVRREYAPTVTADVSH